MNNHNRETKYYEYYAKGILENALPEEYHDIKMQDRPDLINYDSRGIEVTRAMYCGYGEASKMFQLIKNKPVAVANRRALKRLIELGYRIIKLPNGLIAGYGLKEAVWESNREIEYCFTSKQKKIDSYKCDNMELFIFAPMFDSYDLKEIEEYQDWMNSMSKNYNRRFSRVFVYQYKKLFVCDLHNRTVFVIKMDSKTDNGIMQEAITYADKNS